MAASALLWADPLVGYGPLAGYAQATGESQARQPVVDLYATLRTVMRAGEPFERRFDQLGTVIDRDFDLNTILQTSVGLRWDSLDDASRRALFNVFRAFTIASYAANFDKDGGERFDVLPEIRVAGADLIVESKLTPGNGDPVRIDYVMRGGATGWRIVDVLLNGSISRVAVQRSDFRSLLASGSPSPLIASLKQKVTELSDGAMRP
jgi:phospholipid transport system substrate-binding protein